MVFLSGQLGSNQVTSAIEEVEVQTRQALKNINYLLSEAKLTLKNVIKVTVFLTDINNFAAVNTIYAEQFSQAYPARSAFQVSALPMVGLVIMRSSQVKNKFQILRLTQHTESRTLDFTS